MKIRTWLALVFIALPQQSFDRNTGIGGPDGPSKEFKQLRYCRNYVITTSENAVYLQVLKGADSGLVRDWEISRK